MKIVLREHVEHLGERGEVVTVAAGFARNYLIPKKLAMTATPGNMKVLEQQKRVFLAKEAREVGEAQALADRLGQVRLSVKRKAGEAGTLYGSVTTSEIAEMLLAEGFEVDRRRILTTAPIKAVGSYTIPIKLHRQIKVEVHLEVASTNPPPLPIVEKEDVDPDERDYGATEQDAAE